MFDRSDESKEEESYRLNSESGSASTFTTGLGGFLYGLGLTLCVMVSDDDSCNGEGGSIALP